MSPITFIQSFVLGSSDIFLAAKQGKTRDIKKFIETKGGWVDMPDSKGNSLLYYSAKNGHKKIVKYLLENGAHVYGNYKGKCISNRAPHEVKELLAQVQAVKLKDLIEEKVKKSSMPEQVINLITSIQNKEIKKNTLNTFFIDMILDSSKMALSTFDSLKKADQIQIVETMVNTFLGLGDIQSAESVVNKLGAGASQYKYLSSCVNHFKEKIIEIEKVISIRNSDFRELVRKSLEDLNKKYNFCEETIDSLVEIMLENKSMTQRLEYTEGIRHKNIRVFVRKGLLQSGLISVANANLICKQEELQERKWIKNHRISL